MLDAVSDTPRCLFFATPADYARRYFSSPFSPATPILLIMSMLPLFASIHIFGACTDYCRFSPRYYAPVSQKNAALSHTPLPDSFMPLDFSLRYAAAP